jgi:hypothetical protein
MNCFCSLACSEHTGIMHSRKEARMGHVPLPTCTTGGKRAWDMLTHPHMHTTSPQVKTIVSTALILLVLSTVKGLISVSESPSPTPSSPAISHPPNSHTRLPPHPLPAHFSAPLQCLVAHQTHTPAHPPPHAHTPLQFFLTIGTVLLGAFVAVRVFGLDVGMGGGGNNSGQPGKGGWPLAMREQTSALNAKPATLKPSLNPKPSPKCRRPLGTRKARPAPHPYCTLSFSFCVALCLLAWKPARCHSLSVWLSVCLHGSLHVVILFQCGSLSACMEACTLSFSFSVALCLLAWKPACAPPPLPPPSPDTHGSSGPAASYRRWVGPRAGWPAEGLVGGPTI